VGKEPRPSIPRDLFIIDEAVRSEYSFIEPADSCFYVWEYMSHLWESGKPRPDYTQYPANNLISNLQIPVSSQPNRIYWKNKAVQYAARAISTLLPESWRRANATFVPVPPSKLESDPEYDPRLLDILRAVRPKLPDIRSLVTLNSEGFDSKQKGVRPADRAQHYCINDDGPGSEPKVLVLFDDILTTGCHFKAMEMVLGERFPDTTIFGLFLARTVRPPQDYDDIFAQLLA
jgi:hypothetical protein